MKLVLRSVAHHAPVKINNGIIYEVMFEQFIFSSNDGQIKQYIKIDHLFIKKVLLRPIYISHIVTHFIVRQLF